MSLVVKTVSPAGILDGVKGNQLRRDINDIVERGGFDAILINLKDITFMDSSGLSSLVSAQRMVRSANRKLYLCSVNDQVRMVFELTRMDKVFDTFASEEEFNQNIVAKA